MEEKPVFCSNILISIVVIIIVLYVGLVSLVNSNPSWLNNQLVASMVKEPVLKIVSGKLLFSIQGDVKSFSFRFKNPIVDASKILVTNDLFEHRKAYRLENSQDGYWLIVRSRVGEHKTLNNVIISIEMDREEVSNRKPAFVDEISVNGKNISAIELFQKYIKIGKYEKGIVLHYPYSLQNISNTLANIIGGTVVYMVLVTLLLFALVQFVMLVLDIRFPIFNFSRGKHELHMIDKMTGAYSIPLGLFGTIISIWYSLEVTNQYISNYTELVEIIKVAIFTSVLGISSVLMLEVRNRLSEGVTKKTNQDREDG